MKVLVVAPLPPPLTGNSLPVVYLIEELRRLGHSVSTLDINRRDHRSGRWSFNRLGFLSSVFVRFWYASLSCDRVYLTLAESRLGNARDVVLLGSMLGRLHRCTVHLFGGEHMRLLLADTGSVRHALNRFLLGRVKAILVEGKTQAGHFASCAEPGRIHVVSNFAEPSLFLSQEELAKKARHKQKVRVLFLSNLLPGKGHRELAMGYLALNHAQRELISVVIAGKCIDAGDLALLQHAEAVGSDFKYIGPVSGPMRRSLYANADVFILPTYYPFEGQPFVILEAYSTGCFVAVTRHSGISDVFKPGFNGDELVARSANSVTDFLSRLPYMRDRIVKIGVRNFEYACKNYRSDRFVASVSALITG